MSLEKNMIHKWAWFGILCGFCIRASQQQCTFNWVETPGQHADKFIEFGTRGVITEDECKSACEVDESCRAVDYNNQDKSCFLGNVSNSPTQGIDVIDHWELTRNCQSNETSELTMPTLGGASETSPTGVTGASGSPPSSNEECATSYTKYEDRVALNGVLIESIKSSLACITACEFTSSCVGLEMKHLEGEDIECWLHFSDADFKNFYRSPDNTQLILKRCPDQVISLCNSSFTKTQTGKFSTGGILNAAAKTLEDCMQACQDGGPVCRGFDFYSDNRCNLHTEDTLGQNLQTQSGVSQYRLDDVCSAVCVPKWETYQNMKGSGAEAVDVDLPSGNLSACIEYCARKRSCIGVVFESDGESSSSCSYYESDQREGMQQRITQAWAIQYELVDRCALGCNTDYEVMENKKIMLLESFDVNDATNADDCQKYCDLDATCGAFYYTKSDSFVCTMGTNWVYGSDVSDSNYNSVVFKYTECTNSPPTLPPTPQSNVTTPSSGSNTTSGSGSNTTSGTGSDMTTAASNSNTTAGSGSNMTTAAVASNETVASGEPSGASSTATAGNSTGSCSKEWSQAAGKHMLGLEEHGSDGTYTEDECKKECEALPNCKVADYNTLDKGCYLGEQHAEESDLKSNSNINHWEVTEICSTAGGTNPAEATTPALEASSSEAGGQSSNSPEPVESSSSSNTAANSGGSTGSCSKEWSQTAGKHMLGLDEHGSDGTYTEDECKKECEALPNCKVADYNTLDKGCYLGEEYPLTSALRNNPNINHWELLQVCSSGGGSNTTEPVEGSTVSGGAQNSSSSEPTASAGPPATTSVASSRGAAGATTARSAGATTRAAGATTARSGGGATTRAAGATTARSGGGATTRASGVTTARPGGATSASARATTARPAVTTTSSTNASECEAKWDLVPRRNAPGLEKVGEAGEYDEDGCKKLCELISTCFVVDYNSQDSTCFQGTNPNHFTVNNTAVQHWILKERCKNQCSSTVSTSPGMHAQGLKQLGKAGEYTEATCKEACLKDRKCNNLDYNTNDKTCFHGSETNPFLVPIFGINHYNIKRICPD